MSRVVGISILFIAFLISINDLVCCNSQASDMETWQAGMIVGIGNDNNLFEFTDQPVIVSPNKQYYLSVQAQPANNPSNPGDEFFCWLSVVNQSTGANKTNIWRAPCDQELQRSNDSMQLCYFGMTSDGNLLLQHEYSGGPIAFSSYTGGLNVDHAVVDNSGSLLLQTKSNVTVWTSTDHQAPANCLGLLESFNHTLRAPMTKPPSINITATPPTGNSGQRRGRHASHVISIVCALIFTLRMPY